MVNMIEELTQHFKCNEQTREFYAGEQVECLREFMDNDVKIIAIETEGSYQGDYFVILLANNKLWMWHDGFGSCSGCDALDGKSGKEAYDYLMATFTSTKEFSTLKELYTFLDNEEEVRNKFYIEDETIKALKQNLKGNYPFAETIEELKNHLVLKGLE